MSRTAGVWGATAACCAAALLPAGASAAGDGSGPAARDAARGSVSVRASVDPRERTRRIARSFLGFSMEYPEAFYEVGNGTFGVNPIFVGLVENLTAAGSGPPTLRIGGGTSDDTSWNPDREPRPRGVTINIGPGYTPGIAEFARLTGSPLILGLNFAHRDPELAVDMARGLMANLPRGSIRAFEIGNEPDVYPIRVLYEENGRRVYARGRNYDLADWLREVDPFVRSLRRLDPRPPLAGPAAQCVRDWCGGLPTLLRRYGRRLTELHYHGYPLNGCLGRRRSDPEFPTIRKLLSNDALRFAPAFQFPSILGRRYDLPVRITETNSIACGGRRGVSDVFASALWGVDWMFFNAANGVSGLNFHNAAPPYAPFFSIYKDGRYQGVANPLYYGMLFFSRATANGAGLLLNTTLGTRTSAGANVRVWATKDRRGTLRVVVLNKEIRRRARVRISLRSRREGRVTRLSAPNLRSRFGVTVEGQSIPIPTFDGRLEGHRVADRLRPRRGVYRLNVPAGSAAMLTVER